MCVVVVVVVVVLLLLLLLLLRVLLEEQRLEPRQLLAHGLVVSAQPGLALRAMG